MEKKKKRDFITMRCPPEIKETLIQVAEQEHRTLSQQCGKILTDWLRNHGHLEEK